MFETGEFTRERVKSRAVEQSGEPFVVDDLFPEQCRQFLIAVDMIVHKNFFSGGGYLRRSANHAIQLVSEKIVLASTGESDDCA